MARKRWTSAILKMVCGKSALHGSKMALSIAITRRSSLRRQRSHSDDYSVVIRTSWKPALRWHVRPARAHDAYSGKDTLFLHCKSAYLSRGPTYNLLVARIVFRP